MFVLKIVFICLEVLVLFNLLIFAHELGHFLAARWRGLKIERFAIWFGKPIWKTKVNGIEYALGFIPAGGYVSLPQMASMEAIEGKTEEKQEALPPISAKDKIIVAFAGPFFSFLLALVFAVVVYWVGRPVSEAEVTTVIGYVTKDGPAEKAGLRPGDKVLEIDGQPIKKFMGMGASVNWRVVRSEGPTVSVKVLREGKEMVFEPTPTKEPTKAWQRKSLRKIMVAPVEKSVIYSMASNSPAACAGLRAGDEIVGLNGQKVLHPAAIEDEAERHPEQAMTLTVLRGGKELAVTFKPEVPLTPAGEKAQTGILGWSGRADWKLVHPNPSEQVVDSVNAMFATFDALFSRKSDIKPQHLGGFVKIFSVYYLLFESEQGWRMALWFSVVLNVNLALLNLLPFPVLDGGHIVLSLVEAARRRPVNPKFLSTLQTSCAVLLIGYMLYIMFYDVQELPWKHGKEPAPMTFAPKPDSVR
jgi:regulator of sigma E protease